MSRITLYFSSLESPELFRTEFFSPRLGVDRRAVRGKSGRGFGTDYSFQWTSGVRALCTLLLRSEAARRCARPAITLSGERGSLAVSLDQSLGKDSAWLDDIFGHDSRKTLLARKLFSRNNPDRKRPGPVGISLNVSQWKEIAIEVRIKDSPLESSDTLIALADKIEAGSNAGTLPGANKPSPFKLSPSDFDSWKPFFQRTVSQEISEMLSASNIFNRRALSDLARSIQESTSFHRVAGAGKPLVSEIDGRLLGSERLGLTQSDVRLRKELKRCGSIRVALAGPAAASNALFYYLRYFKNIPLELDLSAPHAVETARRIRLDSFDQMPDICVLGSAPAASVLALGSKSAYEPLMLLPKVSQRIVSSPGGGSDLNYGEYLFINDDPSIPSFLFEELEEGGFLNRRRVGFKHMEPDEVLLALSEAGEHSKAILFFPHYHFNAWFNECSFIKDPRSELRNQDTILFAHQRLFAYPELLRALDVALRDAWLSLKENPELVSNVVGVMLEDPVFEKFLHRAGGLHQFT